MTLSKSLFFFVSTVFAGMTLAGCGSSGGGGGGSAPSGDARFKYDMTALSNSPMISAKSVDSQMNGAITKAFGGTNNSDVRQFINERIKYVFHVAEALNFRVSAYNSLGQLEESGTLGEILGDDAKPTSGQVNTAGMNIGAGLAAAEYDSGYEIKIQLPQGVLDAGSYRLGLVVITKYYSVIPDAKGKEYATPLEGRASVLIHEARHSDCPNGNGSSDCGFMHRECASGAAAGIPACDNSTWGPYAMGALYLKSTKNNHPVDSIEYAIIESMADDSFSRLDSQQKNALYHSNPELNSY
jgi:hypothetical protein